MIRKLFISNLVIEVAKLSIYCCHYHWGIICITSGLQINVSTDWTWTWTYRISAKAGGHLDMAEYSGPLTRQKRKRALAAIQEDEEKAPVGDRPEQPPPPPPSPSLSLSDETTPEYKCVICQSAIVNKCKAGGCTHEFCYPCLVRWTNEKPECPLCKAAVATIHHNLRVEDGEEIFDEHTVPARPARSFDDFFDHLRGLGRYRNLNDSDGGFLQRWLDGMDVDHFAFVGLATMRANHNHDQNRVDRISASTVAASTSTSVTITLTDADTRRIESSASTSARRFPMMRVSESDEDHILFSLSEEDLPPPPTLDLAEPLATLPARHHSEFGNIRNIGHGNSNSTILVEDSDSDEENASDNESIQHLYYNRRHSVYDHQQYVSAVPGRTAAAFGCTATYFINNPGELNRIKPWLKRELEVLLSVVGRSDRVMHAFESITSVLSFRGIYDSRFRDMVRQYLDRRSRAVHFQHEFFNFVASGMSMREYDDTAHYGHILCPPRRRRRSVETITLDDTRQYVEVNDDSPSSDEPNRSPSASGPSANPEGAGAGAGNENNENEEDCEFIGIFPIVRPPPLAVITLDDDEEKMEGENDNNGDDDDDKA